MFLSDYNVNEKKPARVAGGTLYADIPLSFGVHPVLEDVRPLTDVDAIRQSVRNLINTNHFERPFQPEIGCNIRALLFDNVDSLTSTSLQDSIQTTLNKYEPRLTDLSVRVNAFPDRNLYEVSLSFRIVNNPTARETVTFELERLR